MDFIGLHSQSLWDYLDLIINIQIKNNFVDWIIVLNDRNLSFPSPGDTMPPENTSTLTVCKQCGKRVPRNNIELHLLHCKPKTFIEPSNRNQKRTKSSASGKKVQIFNWYYFELFVSLRIWFLSLPYFPLFHNPYLSFILYSFIPYSAIT